MWEAALALVNNSIGLVLKSRLQISQRPLIVFVRDHKMFLEYIRKSRSIAGIAEDPSVTPKKKDPSYVPCFGNKTEVKLVRFIYRNFGIQATV